MVEKVTSTAQLGLIVALLFSPVSAASVPSFEAHEGRSVGRPAASVEPPEEVEDVTGTALPCASQAVAYALDSLTHLVVPSRSLLDDMPSQVMPLSLQAEVVVPAFGGSGAVQDDSGVGAGTSALLGAFCASVDLPPSASPAPSGQLLVGESKLQAYSRRAKCKLRGLVLPAPCAACFSCSSCYGYSASKQKISGFVS